MRRLVTWILITIVWLGGCSDTPTFSLSSHGLTPQPLPGSADGAPGSGCVVDGDQLSDGIWFGLVENMSAESVTIDVACYWSGEAAAAMATADGHEPVDFYLSNGDERAYTVQLDAAGTAHWVGSADDSVPKPIPMPDWPVAGSTFYQECPSEHCGAWLYVNGGVATELIEWYLPRWETWNALLPLSPWDVPVGTD